MRTNKNKLASAMSIAMAVASFAAISACEKANPTAAVTMKNNITDLRLSTNSVIDTALKDILPFKMGAAINMTRYYTVPAYKAAAIREFNSVTAEGAMKMAALQPTQGNFVYTDADTLVQFAQVNNMRVHGHTLVWATVPAWVNSFSGTAAQWDTLMKTHIKTVVSHFKGKVASWDVVNEGIADNGTLRDNIWHQHIGDGYIAKAFQYAHEADPDAKLFYNDYGSEYSANRRNGINNLLRSLLATGVPVDGVGLQMHMLKTQSNAGVKAAIDSAAALGILVHISEIDIALNTTNSVSYAVTPADYTILKNLFQYTANTYVHDVPVAKQHGITTWSVNDLYSWRRTTTSPSHPDWPVLLNDTYQHKECYGTFVYGATH